MNFANVSVFHLLQYAGFIQYRSLFHIDMNYSFAKIRRISDNSKFSGKFHRFLCRPSGKLTGKDTLRLPVKEKSPFIYERRFIQILIGAII